MTPPAGRPPHPDVLTPAEWRVLDHLREGRANAEIVVRLGVSINTVRTHVSSMLAKLEVPDRHALAAWDGQPKRRFGWLPALPHIALGLGGGGRIAAVAGGVAIAVLVIALALARTSGTDARTTVVAFTEEGLIGLDAATGAPLAGLTPFDPWRHSVIHEDGLIWQTQNDPDGFSEVAVFDGAAIGLRSSGFPSDQDHVIRRWNLPPLNDTIFPPTLWIGTVAREGHTAYVSRRASLRPDPGGQVTQAHELWRIDVDRAQPRLLTASIQVEFVHVSAARRLFIEPPPGRELIELDPESGDEIGRLVLTLGPGRSQFADDARHLYVFYGHGWNASVIDLDRFAVVDELALPVGMPRTGGTPWDRALSPDAQRLYVAGDDPNDCPDADPDEENRLRSCRPQPIGVQAIDLQTMEFLYEDPDHNRLVLSADGLWLITTLWTYDRDGLSTRPPRGDGLKVIDTTTFEVVAHLEAGKLTIVPAISADGRYAYALQQGPARPWETLGATCTTDCTTLLVIDLDTFEVIARQPYDDQLFEGSLLVVP